MPRAREGAEARRRELARHAATVGVALGAHAAVLGALATIRQPPHLPTPASRAAPAEIDLDEDEPRKGPPSAAEPGDEARASVRSQEARTGAQGAKPTTAGATPGKPTATEGDEGTAPGPRAGDWSFSPMEFRVDVRSAIAPDIVAPSGPRGTESPPPRTGSATGGVSEALAAHDVAIGLGRGGAVLAAAEDAARSAEAPLAGSATFEVVVASDGQVGAHVLSADGDTDAWERIAASLTSRLDPRHVRLPAGARGWRVVVRVDARVQLADGRDVRTLHGPRGSLAPSALSNALAGKEDAGGSSTSPGGPDHVGDSPIEAPPMGGALGRGPSNAGAAVGQGIAARVLPTPTVSVSGKVCSASLTVTPLGIGIGGGCSLENTGNGTSRVVSGRIVREGAL